MASSYLSTQLLPWLLLFFSTAATAASSTIVDVQPDILVGRDHNEFNETRQGWTGSSNQRGTIDIIWSCMVTMFLCSWSILCLNVPSPEDSKIYIFHRRFWLTCLCFLGPEFTMLGAAGEWASARQSAKDFAAAKIEGWTIQHGFFADMGGFMLYARDSDPFPVDAKQLLFLIQNNFVDRPNLSRKTIADKNKVDGLLRIITICQVLWFAINIAGRRATHLAITCFELTTAAFIVCTIGTVGFWIHKPADVQTSEKLVTASSIADIVHTASICFPDACHRVPVQDATGLQRHEHYFGRTPLDFISRKEWHWSLYWSNWINILRHIHINFAPKKLPVDRFENTRFLAVSPSIYFCWVIITAGYGSIFIAAWNYDFPTPVEQTLWRAASISMLGCLVAFIITTEFAWSVYPALLRFFNRGDDYRAPRTRASANEEVKNQRSRFRGRLRAMAASVRNNSENKDPALDAPIKAILASYVIGVVYCTSRTYVLLSDLLELRALPPSAYETVDWSTFLPHW